MLHQSSFRERESSFSPCSTAMPACTFCSFFHKTGRPFAAGCKLAHKNATLKKCTLYQENSSSGERWTSALIPFSECFNLDHSEFRDKEATPCDHASSCRGIISDQSNRMNRWSKSYVFSRVGGSHVLLASCFLNLVTFWQHRPEQPWAISPDFISHQNMSFSQDPKGKAGTENNVRAFLLANNNVNHTWVGCSSLVQISNPEPQTIHQWIS